MSLVHYTSSTKWNNIRCMSQAAYEAKLDRELANFEEELERFLVAKENFLEDFYRRLKQVLGRCKSWRCQGSLGINTIHISSRKQIEELIHWDQSLKSARTRKQAKGTDSDEPKCMLVQFLKACDESKNLHEKFLQLIYKPLHDVFYEEKIKPLAKELNRILWRWKTLLEPGLLNHRLFSPGSAKALYYMNLKNKSHGIHFNLVLRLVPDLAIKSYESLRLAREWRGCLGALGSAKQMEKAMMQWQLVIQDHERNSQKTPDADPSLKSLHTLEVKLKETEQELQDSSLKFQTFYNEVSTLEDRIDVISGEQDGLRRNMKSACEERIVITQAVSRSKQDIDFLQEKLKAEQRGVQRVRDQLLDAQGRQSCSYKQEIHRELLEKKLKYNQEACKYWRQELSNAELEYSSHFDRHVSVRSRLDSARKEMDVSKSKKVLLSQSLIKSRERKDVQAKKRAQSASRMRGIRAELRHVSRLPSWAVARPEEEKSESKPLHPESVNPCREGSQDT